MKNGDLRITEFTDGFQVKVVGRANFDYAVPLRALAPRVMPGNWLRFDMAGCEAMDSTFMGVLTMLALKLKKNGNQVVLLGAGEHLQRLLGDLGVAKLFRFVNENEENNGGTTVNIADSGLLDAAETVVEAHRNLVEADHSNAAKFEQVIKFAQEDVERLKKDQH